MGHRPQGVCHVVHVHGDESLYHPGPSDPVLMQRRGVKSICGARGNNNTGKQ